MSTQAQTLANRANSALSTGPTSEAGKAASSQNNFRHGLSGAFAVLPSETATSSTPCKTRSSPNTSLLRLRKASLWKMAQSYWLRRRALQLQNTCFTTEPASPATGKQLALYLRYQVTHDRAFHQALHDLLKLRNEKRKAENGFESQQRQQEDHARKLAVEKRKQDLHGLDLILAEAKLDHQVLLNRNTRAPSDRASLDVIRHILVRKAA